MNKKSNKNKARIVEYLAVKTSLASDSLVGEARIELRGRNTLFMQGCRRILKCSPEEMVMAAKGFAIRIRGQRLICSTYHDGTVSIDGLIESVALDGGEGKD
jgi:hypothetical protein